MIQLSGVTYSYPGAAHPAVQDLSLQIDEGEFLLVCGPSGAGKSTFLRLLNGLVPHFHGGRFAGSVQLWGRDTLTHQPRDLADLVGFVFQDPEAQFVVDVVEDEIVFAMENLGLAQTVMRRRVEEVLDQLGIAHLRRRRVSSLSGGEQQRVAIAAVLAAQPRVLVLDEPTSQLDPHAAEEVLSALQKLNADLGLTVVLCEHRLERVVQYADRILYFAGANDAIVLGPTRAVLNEIPLVPPLQRVARALGWQPLPLTIKEGRAFVRLMDEGERGRRGAGETGSGGDGETGRRGDGETGGGEAGGEDFKGKVSLWDSAAGCGTSALRPQNSPLARVRTSGTAEPSLSIPKGEGEPGGGSLGSKERSGLSAIGYRLSAIDVTYRYGTHEALYRLSLALAPGELLALMGRNGSGKSTLLRLLAGLLRPHAGRVELDGRDLTRLPAAETTRIIGYVPQDPRSILFHDTLREELAFTLKARAMHGAGAASFIETTLAELDLAHLAEAYPRDLSGGEAQRAALAAILVGAPQLLLLDEPTRGLDYHAKERLVRLLRAQCAAGRTVVMATHDVELAAACADRVAMLGDGELVVDGPAAAVLGDSLLFSSQVAKLFPGRGWLTPADVI